MPTATTLSGYTLINGGPQTTTFTAPASCSTAYETQIGVKFPLGFMADCDYLPVEECKPYGSVLHSIYSSLQDGNPTAGNLIPYQSPGLFCPSGWATVGAATKLNPTSSSTSGAFDIPAPTNTDFFQPYLDIFLTALDPSETAIACCPSSYDNLNGICYSTIPTSVYAPSTACLRLLPSSNIGLVSGTWTMGGETITGVEYMITGTEPLSPSTTSFSPLEATVLVGYAVEGVYLLVHQASDAVAASPSNTNAAASVRGNVNILGAVTILSCLGFVLGALL